MGVRIENTSLLYRFLLLFNFRNFISANAQNIYGFAGKECDNNNGSDNEIIFIFISFR